MIAEELSQLVYELSFTSGMNQQYFQTMEGDWSWWDTAAKIVVAVTALLSLVATCIDEFRRASKKTVDDQPPAGRLAFLWQIWCWITHAPRDWSWSIKWGVVAAIAATTLNIIPAAERARTFGNLYRQWTSLRQQTDELLFDLDSTKKDADPIAMCGEERYRRLIVLRAQIEALEPEPNQKLVQKCYADESQRRWGAGVKSLDEREKAFKSRSAAAPQRRVMK